MSTTDLRTPVVVTGAASGIGRAVADELAAAGRPVALWDLDPDRAAEAAGEVAGAHGVAAVGQGVDVTASDALPAAVAAASAALGPVGGLVHAAGTSGPTPLGTLTDASWGRLVDVHLRAFAMVVQAVAPDLRSRPGSAVVGIGSLSSYVGFDGIPAYGASKAGLLGLARSLALTLAPDGVRVNVVCPGYIDTPMLRQHAIATPEGYARTAAAAPLGRLGEAADVARAVRFLMGPDASYVTGTSLVVDGGVLARSA